MERYKLVRTRGAIRGIWLKLIRSFVFVHVCSSSQDPTSDGAHARPVDSWRMGARVQLVARYFVAREEKGAPTLDCGMLSRLGGHGTESRVCGDVQPVAHVHDVTALCVSPWLAESCVQHHAWSEEENKRSRGRGPKKELPAYLSLGLTLTSDVSSEQLYFIARYVYFLSHTTSCVCSERLDVTNGKVP